MAGKGKRDKALVTHPRSRKVRQLERQARREKRIGRQKERRGAEAALEALRFFWFREQCLNLKGARTAFTLEEARVLTEHYLRRNEDEITSLKSMRNPPVGRIKTIEGIKTKEEDAFRSSKGLTIPDITDSDNLEILTTIWDGRTDTAGVVRRLALKRCTEPSLITAMGVMQGKLLPIDQVRERAAAVAPSKALKFQASRRAQSVKKSLGAEEVLLRSKKRGIEHQARRLKRGRNEVLREMRTC